VLRSRHRLQRLWQPPRRSSASFAAGASTIAAIAAAAAAAAATAAAPTGGEGEPRLQLGAVADAEVPRLPRPSSAMWLEAAERMAGGGGFFHHRRILLGALVYDIDRGVDFPESLSGDIFNVNRVFSA
jgi:hypothetical protein